MLLLYCAEYQIKLIISKEEKEWVESRLLDEEMAKKKEEILNVVYNLLRFDIDQRQI